MPYWIKDDETHGPFDSIAKAWEYAELAFAGQERFERFKLVYVNQLIGKPDKSTEEWMEFQS